jgi:4-hydroxybenzoate polyprenyltransferase
MVAAASELRFPLCVDLDGTLIRTDVLLESLLRLIKRNPLYALLAVCWAVRGRAVLQSQLASRVPLNAATLPYDAEWLKWIGAERQAGGKVWLCTTSNRELAQSVADHLGVFDAVVMNDSDSLARAAGMQPAAPRISSSPHRGRDLLRALRPHQWAKNLLVLVPLATAHRLGVPGALGADVLAIVAFCLCASSVYVLNDLLDLEADRAHPRKCARPFASGSLPLATGFALFPALLICGSLLAAFLPARFQIALALYYALTCGYSFVLKRFLLVDAVALAGLYTLRIIAGAGAAGVALSFWLLLFSVFLFLSLAFVKRYAELDALRRQQRLQALGRGYRVEDLAVLQSFGTAAGYLSVLVLALYINSPEIQPLYHRPKAIWMLCVLMLYWISRVWMTAHRGSMHDDPVVYALRDRVSLAIGVLAAITVGIAV